jgi:3-mercaptopyruvate sulfurtransferase SseA
MRLYVSIAGAALLAVVVLAACNSNELTRVKGSASAPASQPAQLPPADDARRITPAELKAALASNSAVLIDVRTEAAYKDGHIKGARLIPFADILAHVDELPRDKTIVTYCS